MVTLPLGDIARQPAHCLPVVGAHLLPPPAVGQQSRRPSRQVRDRHVAIKPRAGFGEGCPKLCAMPPEFGAKRLEFIFAFPQIVPGRKRSISPAGPALKRNQPLQCIRPGLNGIGQKSSDLVRQGIVIRQPFRKQLLLPIDGGRAGSGCELQLPEFGQILGAGQPIVRCGIVLPHGLFECRSGGAVQRGKMALPSRIARATQGLRRAVVDGALARKRSDPRQSRGSFAGEVAKLAAMLAHALFDRRRV